MSFQALNLIVSFRIGQGFETCKEKDQSFYSLWMQDILVGLLRLRKCGKNVTCPELMGKCSVVRELHVYGTAVPVHGREADKLQHQVPEIQLEFDT